MKQIIAFSIAIMLLCTISLAFSDTSDHTLQSYIEEAANAGIITGYPDNTFRPDIPVNRAEFVAMINRALGIAGCAVSQIVSGKAPANAGRGRVMRPLFA